MVKVNFANVEERDFEPLPKGWYDVRIEDVDPRENSEESKHPGNEFWNVDMIVTSGDYEGRHTFTNLMLPCEACAEAGGQADGHDEKDYSPFMLLGILKAAGEVPEDADPGDVELELDPEDLVGLQFQVNVGRGKGDNKDREEVKRFKPLAA